MKQAVLFGVLCVFQFHGSETQLQGMYCLDCNDVSSPKECQETTICGQDEICSTREYIDHHHRRGFHLGCESKAICELVYQAQTLLGKRDDAITASPHRCFECCAGNECNGKLCEVPAGGHVMTTPSPTVILPDVTCMSCEGVESPEHCRQTTACGNNEVCFTRKYTDHRGLPAYRLGCESKARCSLFLNAQTLFGKRHLSDPASPVGCYDCCSSHECNIGLCQGSYGTSYTASSSSSTKMTTTLPTMTSKSCPASFVAFRDNCYLFEPVMPNRTEARLYCQRLGADLLSVHSKKENDFIATELKALGAHQTLDFWTGGVYSHTGHQWEWVDGSSFNYTNWNGNPPASYSPEKAYYLVMGNPSYSSQYTGAPMWAQSHYSSYPNYGVICKTVI